MKSRRKQLVLGLALGLVAAGSLAGPAQARPDDLGGTVYARDDSPVVATVGEEKLAALQHMQRGVEQQPQVIPYLSQGIGVDESLFAGERPVVSDVIPYLSQGIGVDASLYQGDATLLNLPDGRAGDPKTFGVPQAAPVAIDDGTEFSWRDAGLGAAGAVLLATLMAATALLLRRTHRGLAAS